MKQNNSKMKVFTALCCSLLMFNANSQNPVADNGALSVTGTHITNESGNVVSFAGNSFFWSMADYYDGALAYEGGPYYNENVVNWLADDWNTSIVRCAMGVFQQWTPEGMGYLASPADSIEESNKVRAVVDAAIAKGIYVIVDWHSHDAHNQEDEAIEFFEMMAEEYGQYDNVIYEIYNEPLQVSWSNTIKPYAENVIAAIRAIDPDNLIIVGTPNWDQYVDEAALDPITSSANIAYSLHFYAAQAEHKQDLRDRATFAINNGIALFVTEWGTVNAFGQGAVDETSTNEWMDFLCENSISHCNWSIGDKKVNGQWPEETASALEPMTSIDGNWTDNDLTVSGTLVKSIISGWADRNCDATNSIGSNDKIAHQLFPNPAKNILYLVAEGEYNVSISDAAGRVIREETGENNSTINIENLVSGSYFVQISNEQGTAFSKVIKL